MTPPIASYVRTAFFSGIFFGCLVVGTGAVGEDPPLSQTCLRMLVRLGEYRGALQPGVWRGREGEMPSALVDSLVAKVLTPEERAELARAVAAAEKRDPGGPHPAHAYLNNLINESSVPIRGEFNDPDQKYLDDIEVSRLMAKARAGEQQAMDRLGEILPAVLRRKAARQFYFLQKEDQEEIADQVLLNIIRANFSFSMGKVQVDTSNRALAAYLTTAMIRTYARWRDKRNLNGEKIVTSTDLQSDADFAQSEVLENFGQHRPGVGQSGGAEAASIELEGLRKRVIPLLPPREAAALNLKLTQPTATTEDIARVTGAPAHSTAKFILDRAMQYTREIEDVFKDDVEGLHLSQFAQGLTDKEREAFSLISFGGKTVDQVASEGNVQSNMVRPAYLSAVGKMEAAMRSKHPEEMGRFWDRILSTSGFHADVLNELVEYSLTLGRLPKAGEIPAKVFSQGWSEEQVYGLNNFRPQPGKPVNALFYSRSQVNWLIAREIERRKPFMQKSDKKVLYENFDPHLAPLPSRRELYVDHLVEGLGAYRQDKQDKVIGAYVEHFIQTGELLDVTDELPQHVGMARRRLLSEGQDFAQGGKFEGTGVFDSKSDFQKRLAERLKATDAQLSQRHDQALDAQAKEKIDGVRQKVRELMHVAVHNKANLVELPDEFRRSHPFVSQHLSALAPIERNILALRWGQKLSIDATAAQLGISPKQVANEELIALIKLREKAMEEGRELNMGREVATIATSLPSLVTDHLYAIWKADPENFDFNGAWAESQGYVVDRWPEIRESYGSAVFRGKDHAVWMLREKIREKVKYLNPGDSLYQAHQDVVDRGASVSNTATSASRNPYRGHLEAQVHGKPEPKVAAPSTAARPFGVGYRAAVKPQKDILMEEVQKHWGEQNSLVLSGLRPLDLTEAQRAVIRGKWMNQMSNEEILPSLPKRMQKNQALVDAETSLLFALQKSAETTGKSIELAEQLASLSTLQSDMARFALSRLKAGEDLEGAIDTYYSNAGLSRPTSNDHKIRPFLNKAHRDLVLVQLARQQGDTEMVAKLLEPYKPGGALSRGTRTIYRTELMRQARP